MTGAPADTEDGDRPLGRVLASSLWFPALFFVGFLTCYLLPFHAPAPHDVRVAVAGPQVAAAVAQGLEQQAPGAFEIVPAVDDAAARAAVTGREVVAAYVVDEAAGRPTASLYTSSAEGKLLVQVVSSTFQEVAGAEGTGLRSTDLVPTAPGDVTGTGLFYLALVWNLIPYVTVMMLLRATELTRRGQLLVLAGVGAFISVGGWAVALALDVVPNHPLTLLYAFMITQAVAWTTYGLAPIVKQFIPGVAITLFVLLSIPSSGGAIPHQLVPAFFRALHPVMPLGNVVDAVRGVLYYDGAGLVRPTLVLLAWLVLSGALVVAVSARQRRREREEAEPQGGSLARPAVEDPTLRAPTPHAIAPGSHGPLGQRSVVLGGLVRRGDGEPVADVFITVLGTGGRQLLTARTDERGRYAVAGLPDDPATVVLLAIGYAPAAARVVLQAGHALRQDFDLVAADPVGADLVSA